MTKRDFLKSYREAEKQISLERAKGGGCLEEIARLEKQQAEVLAAIETAPRPIMRAALAAHFVNGMHWSRVAYALGYGEDNMYKLLNAALKDMTFPAGVE